MLTHIHPSAPWFASKVAPTMSPGPTVSGYSGGRQAPRAPSRAQGVTSRAGTSRIPSAGSTPPSSLLRAHAPVLNPPAAYGHSLGRPVFAGCCQPLLGVGPSRRYLCESVSACLNPYPGCSRGALARFFPQDNGLPDVRTRSALGNTHTMATSVWTLFRGCSYSIIFRPADLLAPPSCSYRSASRHQAVRAFTSPPISVRYLPEQEIC